MDLLAGIGHLWRRFAPASVPRMRGSRGVGQAWEDLAARELRRAGYRILDRNFRAGPGEIDFVARDGRVLCFIEVKGRRGRRFGLPEESVTLEKQRRIVRAAETWVRVRRVPSGARRFDVISILEEGRAPARVWIIRGAFEAPPPRRPRW